MGVEEIIARMNADAAAEAARILHAAEGEVSHIQREGEIAAEAAYTTISADGRQEAENRRRKILARAQLAARGGVRKAREEGITRCFTGAKEHLALLPHMPVYTDVLRHLIAEGQEVIGQGKHEVLFREEDQDAAEAALVAFPDVTAALLREESTDRSGGGIVVTCRMHRCDQRFSARCERMRGRLTRETAHILFGGHD
ncbi:V-type ATP synthase subunit E [Methanogenium sp. MK-MG]|uniref:V-type ATP synthase subunit E n=1 Tax=Methanogenium sp. MK-MG TaxID=2599926 RepID=UPI0013EB8856|nr:V-type ATP synthase subunit E family protein [Methanogenium sp. MK-MG]KAF1078822.1 V-type ATP synthase subunit E [Methanogenium sp. MK-MG]